LPIDQRVALAEILRHAHQGVVGGLVAVRVETAQHVTHHARTFHRLGGGVAIGAAVAQAHALHGVQDATLHGLLAVTYVGQGTAFDDAERVFQIGALGVGGQAVGVAGGRGQV